MSEMVERFWAKVDSSDPKGCWPWTRSMVSNGRGMLYGSVRHDGKMQRAHRVAYMISVGPIPKGLVVRHKCDNGVCCNPAHLQIGTQKDNVKDRYERGRDNHVRGSGHGIAKLDEARVVQIKHRLASGGSHRIVASAFGVSSFTIGEIARGNSWQHVKI